MSSLKELVISDVGEDLVCADYLYDENLLALGGTLGVGYLYQLAASHLETGVTINIDDDEAANQAAKDDSEFKPEGFARLNGHFAEISCIQFRPLEATKVLGQTT